MQFNKDELIKSIKSKRELKGIDNSVVQDLLDNEIRMNNLKIEELRKRDVKMLIKKVRAKLRGYAGQYQEDTKKRDRLLEKEDFESLLKSHSSTKERMMFYPEIRKVIKNLNVKSILDLGCGINPVALAEKNVKYAALDINESDLEIVRRFFEKEKINGKVFVYDLRKFNYDLPEADLCLLLKVLDTIETGGHNLAEKIISGLRCKYILASFATRALSGRKMNSPKRGWIRRMLTRLNIGFETFGSDNEIFYLIKKAK